MNFEAIKNEARKELYLYPIDIKDLKSNETIKRNYRKKLRKESETKILNFAKKLKDKSLNQSDISEFKEFYKLNFTTNNFLISSYTSKKDDSNENKMFLVCLNVVFNFLKSL
jgi:hypothetical protein